MNKYFRSALIWSAALALSAGIAGCVPSDRASVSAAQPGTRGESPAPGQVAAQALTPEAVPPDLQAWVNSQGGAETPASAIVNHADTTYLAVTGGLQPSGGYRIEISTVTGRDGAWIVAARLVPPPSGKVVTAALTNPAGLFWLPRLEGEVRVRLDDTLLAPARLPTPVSAHAAGPTPGTAAPDTGAAAPVPSPAPAEIIPADEAWSTNFRVTRPRQVSAAEVRLEGKARVFEGAFEVELWAGGRKLAWAPVQADEGGPAFGHFTHTLTVPGGVPAGAEVRFIVESAADGTRSVELTVPVEPRKEGVKR